MLIMVEAGWGVFAGSLQHSLKCYLYLKLSTTKNNFKSGMLPTCQYTPTKLGPGEKWLFAALRGQVWSSNRAASCAGRAPEETGCSSQGPSWTGRIESSWNRDKGQGKQALLENIALPVSNSAPWDLSPPHTVWPSHGNTGPGFQLPPTSLF